MCRSSGGRQRARRPSVDPLQRPAHERGLLAVGEPLGHAERIDPLPVGQQRDGARPVRAPHAAIEAVGVEDAGERVPDVRVGERLVRQRAGAADLDADVVVRRQRQHVRQIGPRLRRRRRLERLLQPEMVDHHHRARIAGDQSLELVEPAPAEQVDRQRMPRRRGQHPVHPGIGGIFRRAVRQHQPDRDRAVGRGPRGDRVLDRGVARVDRLDHAKSVGMRRVDLERVAGVVAIERIRRDQQRRIDADRVHRGHHLLARRRGRTGEMPDPRPARLVAIIGMHLRVDREHRISPQSICRVYLSGGTMCAKAVWTGRLEIRSTPWNGLSS